MLWQSREQSAGPAVSDQAWNAATHYNMLLPYAVVRSCDSRFEVLDCGQLQRVTGLTGNI